MTIACCVIVPEGIVLGADSTASMPTDNGHLHYFNHNQKLFQIGSDSTLGLLTWGLGGLGSVSYRTVIAKLDDELKKCASTVSTVREVAERWSALIWQEYNDAFPSILLTVRALEAKLEHVPGETSSKFRTKGEEDLFQRIRRDFHAGFCIAGYCDSDRMPKAFSIEISPLHRTPPVPVEVHHRVFWGVPNIVSRVMKGFDPALRQALLESGKWSGDEIELDRILDRLNRDVPNLPIRDAIDYAHWGIHTTIKALKFSSLPQICGGPIEIAVIRTDRKFEWVKHKGWDSAISEGEI